MTYKDKAPYGSSLPCMHTLYAHIQIRRGSSTICVCCDVCGVYDGEYTCTHMQHMYTHTQKSGECSVWVALLELCVACTMANPLICMHTHTQHTHPYICTHAHTTNICAHTHITHMCTPPKIRRALSASCVACAVCGICDGEFSHKALAQFCVGAHTNRLQILQGMGVSLSLWEFESTQKVSDNRNRSSYAVATISRLLKIICLFCKRAL